MIIIRYLFASTYFYSTNYTYINGRKSPIFLPHIPRGDSYQLADTNHFQKVPQRETKGAVRVWPTFEVRVTFGGRRVL
jgi:hypothetical protein